MTTKTQFRADWYKTAENTTVPSIEVGDYGQEIRNVKLEVQTEPDYFRIVIFGVPGTPIFELGEDLSEYYDIDMFELSREYEDYWGEKIPSNNIDLGDRDSGSASQHQERDIESVKKRRAIDRFLNIPNIQPDPLPWEDKVQIYGIPNAIIVTEIAESVLLQWLKKGKGQAFFIDCEEEKAVEWMKERRKCLTCGSMFHSLDNPERFKGVCNRCGTDLIYRERDRPESVRHQYNIWRQDFTEFKKQMAVINMTTLKMDEMDYKKMFDQMISRINSRLK